MILNNKKPITAYMWILITVILCSFLVFVFVSFSELNALKDSVIRWLAMSSFFICFIFLFQIRCFQYEYFKEFMTIRIFHPWKKGLILPAIELPKDYIKDYLIEKQGWSYKLQLIIEAGNGKNITKKYTMFGFKDHQVTKLKFSLEELKIKST